MPPKNNTRVVLHWKTFQVMCAPLGCNITTRTTLVWFCTDESNMRGHHGTSGLHAYCTVGSSYGVHCVMVLHGRIGPLHTTLWELIPADAVMQEGFQMNQVPWRSNMPRATRPRALITVHGILYWDAHTPLQHHPGPQGPHWKHVETRTTRVLFLPPERLLGVLVASQEQHACCSLHVCVWCWEAVAPP